MSTPSRLLLFALALLPPVFARGQTIPAAPGNVTISEVNYHAYDPTTAEKAALGAAITDDDFDFIEILNLSNQSLLMSGCQITGGVTYAFNATPIPANARRVIVKNLTAFTRRYGLAPNYTTLPASIVVLGTYTSNLSDGGEAIGLRNATQTIKEFTYNDTGSWPGRADGLGASLEIIDTTGDYNDGANWRGSREYGGTPCTAGTGPLTTVVINEILAHSDVPYTDFIELHNTTASSINIGGWVITDDLVGSNISRFTIPAGTILAANQYLVFNTLDFAAVNPTNPLAFSEYGESIFLIQFTAGRPTAFVDDVNYLATDVNRSIGRYVNSAGEKDFTEMASITIGADPAGAPNSAPAVGPLVFSEVMYNPYTNELEYVEIRNIGNSVVNLWDNSAEAAASTNKYWELASAVTYKFAVGNRINPGEYILVTETNAAIFRARYNIPAHVQVFGPYSGSLSNGGETLRLRRPGTYDTLLVGNPTVLVDRVSFDDIAPWPLVADGTGPALERLNLTLYGNDPANWVARNNLGSPGGPPQIDGDGDGVVDNWEYAKFATLANNNFATADRDSDGQTDYAEYLAGTDPFVSNASFRLSLAQTGASFLASHPTLLASGPGYYGRTRGYALQRKGTLAPGAWTTVITAPATGGTVQHNLTPADPLQYYRVEILLP